MSPADERVRLTGDRLDLEWRGQAALTQLAARCTLENAETHETASWQAVAGADERYRAFCGPLQIELQLELLDGCLRMCMHAVATRPADVLEVGLVGRCQLNGSAPAWFLYNGFQSWDAAGCLPAGGGLRESWWTTAATDAHGGGLAAVSTAARSSCTRFTLSGDAFSAIWCETPALESRRPLFAGSEGTVWRGEHVLLAAGRDARQCLATLVGRSRSASPADPRLPVGWLSWYHFGPWVRLEDVLANASFLAASGYRELGYWLVQVDDGWQEAYGEWRPNTKFPGGLKGLCDELSRRGQVTGLWTAPFLVSPAADLAAAAPDDWFLVDSATGERAIDPLHGIFGPMYVLDASNPAVQAHLRDLFAGFFEAGVRYFKIDFLYAGAYAGTKALRAGIEAIRSGVRDAQVLACGAPLLPMVGLVDACRIGPDTATPLHDFETGISMPNVFGDEVLAVARNAAARSFLHPWFRLDVDVALVGGNLTLDQARQLVTMAAVSGGPFLASDDLTCLPPERLSLLTNPEVMALVGSDPAVPDWDPAEGDHPPVHWRRGDVLAVFNWSQEDRDVAVVAPGASAARDLWARIDLDGFHDGAVLHVPAAGVRLLRVR